MSLNTKWKHILMRVVIVVNVCMMAYTINDLVHVAYLYEAYDNLVEEYYHLVNQCHD